MRRFYEAGDPETMKELSESSDPEE
jgi:hypothetical protein